MTMPPEKVAVLVITGVIAILLSLTLLNSPDRILPERQISWSGTEAERAWEDLSPQGTTADVVSGRTRTPPPKRSKVAPPTVEVVHRADDVEVVRNDLAPTPARAAPERHRIADGDTLGALALRYLGDAQLAGEIERVNPGVDAKRLRIGTELVIPSLARSRPVEPVKPVSTKGSSEGDWVVARPGDNLSRIAKRHLGDANAWKKIYVLNDDVLKDPSRVAEGTRLRLPRRD